ncbi:MAG: hypothetical protein JTT11_02015 [Candidatus Brockarchaeota archaeon]|nr:hypothetical protein [Candidatus Brockarchaeota archaeon]
MPSRTKMSGALALVLAVGLGFSMALVPTPYNSIVPFIAVGIFVPIAKFLGW